MNFLFPTIVYHVIFLQHLLINFHPTTAQQTSVAIGNEICVTGYVMDFFCIQRGTLFDNRRVETLSPNGPSSHSVHCLIEVPSCVKSPFEILVPLEDGSGNFGRAWRIEDNIDVVTHVKKVGSCSTCDNKYQGEISNGYRATFKAEVLDLGSGSTPPLIKVTSVQDYEVGCDTNPTTSPTASPIGTSPTKAPVIASNCVDSSLRIKFFKNGPKRIARDCSWVDKKDTKTRCKLVGVLVVFAQILQLV